MPVETHLVLPLSPPLIRNRLVQAKYMKMKIVCQEEKTINDYRSISGMFHLNNWSKSKGRSPHTFISIFHFQKEGGVRVFPIRIQQNQIEFDLTLDALAVLVTRGRCGSPGKIQRFHLGPATLLTIHSLAPLFLKIPSVPPAR